MNKSKFSKIAESLRQYQRADLRDFDDELKGAPVDALYVDPLPDNAVLNSALSGNTTFLLGRKGTGKSTVFARAQSEFRKSKDILSIYIDVKSLYDIIASNDAPVKGDSIGEIDPSIYRAHMLRKHFLRNIVSELLHELNEACEGMSLLASWTGKKRTYNSLIVEIERIRTKLKTLSFDSDEIPVLTKISKRSRQRQQEERGDAVENKAKLGLKSSVVGPSGEFSCELSEADFEKTLDDHEIYTEYSDVVLRSFPYMDMIDEINELLHGARLKRLVVFFDDFSELNFLDQKLFVDVVLAPLNNSSRKAIKLKVAGYPGRVYYGKIDATKVDTVNLDFASIYEANDVQTMEQSAVDYTTRLLETRFTAFGVKVSDYFDQSVEMKQYMRLLFETTFNVPRLMGALLHYCYLDRVSRGQTINLAAIRLASRKHYETTIIQYFARLNRFAREPFENKLDRNNQKELLKMIIAEVLKTRRKVEQGEVGGSYFKDVKNPPASHFSVSPDLGAVFQSLESNFLVSKYKDTRDKDGKTVTIYALYYGLTELERIQWGCPIGRAYRHYFVQRCFNLSGSVHEFLTQNQTIRCSNCTTCFPLDQLESIKMYKWRCPECLHPSCEVVDLSSDFKDEMDRLADTDLLLEEVELEILGTLNESSKSLRAGDISPLIDVTYQFVGKRTSKLRDLGLIEKKDSGGHMKSSITKKAQKIYFK